MEGGTFYIFLGVNKSKRVNVLPVIIRNERRVSLKLDFI